MYVRLPSILELASFMLVCGFRSFATESKDAAGISLIIATLGFKFKIIERAANLG